MRIGCWECITDFGRGEERGAHGWAVGRRSVAEVAMGGCGGYWAPLRAIIGVMSTQEPSASSANCHSPKLALRSLQNIILCA